MKAQEIIEHWIIFKYKCIEKDILNLEEQIKLFEVWINSLE